MHRALRIDEVLRIAFERDLCNEHDLYHLALTCKTFLEPALDGLWYNLNEFRNLLRVLPPDAISEDVRSGENPEYSGEDLIRPLIRGEWNRFDFYAKRIKSMTLTMWDYDIPSPLVDHMKASLHSRSTPILFPVTRAISVHGCTSALPILFLSPQTHAFKITFDFDFRPAADPYPESLVKDIIARGVTLKSLALPRLSSQDDLPSFQAAMAPFLQDIQIWGSVDWTGIEVLGSLPLLQNLDLGGGRDPRPTAPENERPTWFPSLREIRAHTATLLLILLPIKSSNKLENVYAKGSSSVHAQQVVHLVAQSLPHIRLLDVFEFEYDNNSDKDDNGVWDQPGLCLSGLQHCSKLTNFRLSKLEFGFAEPLADEEWTLLAQGWKELKHLSINIHMQHGATLSTVAAFSRHCPDLESITMGIEFPETLPASLVFGRLPKLKSLDLGVGEWGCNTNGALKWVWNQVGAEMPPPVRRRGERVRALSEEFGFNSVFSHMFFE